jgi:hypothetical protein
MLAKRWVVVSMLVACHSGPPSGGRSSLKGNLDLSGVIGLAIAKQTSHRDVKPLAVDADACVNSNLYTVDATGAMTTTTVTYTPMMGDSPASCNTSMSTENATAIYDTKKYDIITYTPSLAVSCGLRPDGGTCELECNYVVLRKSDGALFCGPMTSIGSLLKGDADVLYTGGGMGGGLVRIDMSTPAPQATDLNPMSTGQMIDDFNGNNANDVLTSGTSAIMTSTTFLRVYKYSGGILNIGNFSASTGELGAQWYNAATDTFYYATSGDGVTPQAIGQTIYQLASGTYAPSLTSHYSISGLSDGGAVVLTTATQSYQVTSDIAGHYELTEMFPSAAGGVCQGLRVGLKTCSSDADCAGTCTNNRCVGGAYAGQNCGGTFPGCTGAVCQVGGAEHELTGVYSIQRALGSGITIFLIGADQAGNNLIDGVDVSQIGETGCSTTTPCGTTFGSGSGPGCCSSPIAPTELLAPGDYSLGTTALSSDGELTFTGVRFSDGASVVGNCTATGCTVLNATAPQVTTLVRIN